MQGLKKGRTPAKKAMSLSYGVLILEETLLKKGFFQAIFLKLLKVLKGFKGESPFEKRVFPLT